MSGPYKKIKGEREHRVIAERILGRPLRGAECVHHWDGNGLNNERTNLVICPDQAYHTLLHTRAAAYDACGNPYARKCSYCKEYDETRHMTLISRGKDSYYYHKKCATLNYYKNKQRIEANRKLRRMFGKVN